MQNSFDVQWIELKTIASHSFTCWNCGKQLASEKGYYSKRKKDGYEARAKIYICHHCSAPNIFDDRGKPTATVPVGRNIKNLPEEINGLYQEVRKSISAEAYTGAIMLFRKLLMNIAVTEDAEESKSFAYYVNYLNEKGIIPIKSQHLADKVRTLGNEANHEIENRTYEEAMGMLVYIELLLHCNYEVAEPSSSLT